ncbi:hypothetical protein BH09ACT7_BH09ACT7_06190 [soil metagenome]
MTAAPEQLLDTLEALPRSVREYAASSQARVLAYTSLVAALSGILATIPSLPVVQSLFMLVLLLCGAGSAVLCWVELPTGASLAGVIGLSLAAVIALTTLLVRWNVWHPELSCVILSLAIASSGLARLWTLKECPTVAAVPGPPRVGGKLYPAVTLLILALSIWWFALPLLEEDDGAKYGLLGTPGGALLILAMAAAVSSFVAAVFADRAFLAALTVLAAVVIGRVTATLITEVPIYAWTYKHIGVVDYLIDHRSLAPYWTDIYVRWPGFFTAMGWFSTVTGLDPVDAAHWFAPVVDIMIVTVIGALVFGVTHRLRAALVAALLVQLVNWVGQDYYSPQAVSLVMAFSILALLLCSKQFVAAGYLSVPIFAAIVATHQLTPVWLIAVVIALAVFRQLRPFWLPVIYVLIWVAYVVPRLDSVSRYGLVKFDPVANSAGTTVSERAESAGYQFTVVVDRGLTVTIWVLAAVCILILWRRKAMPWAAAILAYSPILLLGGQSYGGEATMRVFLYSMAGCALLLAPFLARALTGATAARRLVPRTVAWMLMLAFAIAGMHGYYSAWSFATVTRSQLDQSRWLLATNQENRVITVWAPGAGWPERPSGDYVKFALADSLYDVPLDELRSSVLKEAPSADDMKELERSAQGGGAPVYVVLPRQLYQYDAWTGLFKPGVLDGLKKQLATRPGWTEVINDANTAVYRYSQG